MSNEISGEKGKVLSIADHLARKNTRKDSGPRKELTELHWADIIREVSSLADETDDIEKRITLGNISKMIDVYNSNIPYSIATKQMIKAVVLKEVECVFDGIPRTMILLQVSGGRLMFKEKD